MGMRCHFGQVHGTFGQIAAISPACSLPGAAHREALDAAWLAKLRARTLKEQPELRRARHRSRRPARDELRRRSGRTAVPTFEIDGQLLTPGFSERSIVYALRTSVEKRLGCPGSVYGSVSAYGAGGAGNR